MEKTYTLTQTAVDAIVNNLAEIPTKYGMPLLNFLNANLVVIAEKSPEPPPEIVVPDASTAI
jgi:hypothetical protein